jgi:hypothetical protein
MRSAAVRVGGCQCPRDGGERPGLLFAGEGLGVAFRVGDEPGSAVRFGGCQRPRDVGERAGLPVVVGDGPGDSFRAVRVGGCQCPRDGGERPGLRDFAEGLGGAVRGGDKPGGAVRVGGCQCPRDGGERAGLPVVVVDGLSDAFCIGQERIAVSSDVMRVGEGFDVRCGRGLEFGTGAGLRS